MINRSRSCPGGLHSLQNTSLSDFHIPRAVSLSDLHGLHISSEVRRFDTKSFPSLSNGNQSLTPARPHANSSLAPVSKVPLADNRLGVTFKASARQIQVASVPICKEQPCKATGLKIFNSYTKLGAVKNFQSDQSDDLELRTKDSDELRFPIPFSFATRHRGEAFAIPISLFDPLEIVRTKSTEKVNHGPKESKLRKVWKREKEKRRIRGLVLLNVLAALYGSSNVALKFVADEAPFLPASLTSLVRFTSALIFFSPVLLNTLKNRDIALLRAGAELGAMTFAATVVDSYNPTSGSSSSPALLFAFTVIFVPVMEICAGRQLRSGLTRLATLAAIVGMGLLEEEGFGWRGISYPQFGDLWGLTVSVISAAHIFRSEAHGNRFDPLRLNAVQCGVLATLSLGWETFSTFDPSALQCHELLKELPTLPWVPLIYNGLVCFGLCSLLEFHGLRSIHASTTTLVYTTIPVWGAFLSFRHHDTPPESALIGVSVIMATSIFAHLTTKTADHIDVRIKSLTPNSSKTCPREQSVNIHTDTQAFKDESVKVSPGDFQSHEYFPGALLTSQLKFPYYAAQAKKLLTGVKIKFGALKSVLLTTASSSVLTTSVGNAPSSPTGLVSPMEQTNGSSGLTGNGPNTATAFSHVAAPDLSTAQHMAHGPTVVVPLSSSGAEIINSTASSSAHAVDITVFVNTGLHALTAVTSGLESAAVAAGSDILLGFEEMEDVATFLEHSVQAGVTACIAGAAGLLGAYSEAPTQIQASVLSVHPSPELVDSIGAATPFFHLFHILPLMSSLIKL